MRARRGFPWLPSGLASRRSAADFTPAALFHPPLHFPRRKSRPKQKKFSPCGRCHSARRRYSRRTNSSLNPGAWRDSQAR